MRKQYVYMAVRLWTIEIVRNRIILLLLLILPALFYTIAWITLSGDRIIFILASVKEKPVVPVVQQELGLIFIGLAATGLIASFLALTLIQKNPLAKKRLLLCGYRTVELFAATIVVVLLTMVILGIYVALIGSLFMRPMHLWGVISGYIICGYVYGSYGLLVGAILKGELEGILFIVLLANLDVAWLQNPIYYSGAQTKAVIEWLPAFFPSQTTIIAAFTNYSPFLSGLAGFAYGTLFLIIAFLIFWYRTLIAK
jgi:hypothetical protein